MASEVFLSVFKPVLDRIVGAAPTVAGAVSLCIEFEDAHDLSVPGVYVSTAITSAGYRRDETLDLEEVIRRNNTAAALIMAALVEHDAPQIRSTDVMLPTELGKVGSWRDSDYLLFYFAWAAGLSVEGVGWLETRMADPVYAQIIASADDRTVSNPERWPYYRLMVELMLTNLALAESRQGAKRSEGSGRLLQLVDTAESLGCRAEELYADVRGLDRLSVTFARDLQGAVGEEVTRLRGYQATVGSTRKPVQLVPALLR